MVDATPQRIPATVDRLLLDPDDLPLISCNDTAFVGTAIPLLIAAAFTIACAILGCVG